MAPGTHRETPLPLVRRNAAALSRLGRRGIEVRDLVLLLRDDVVAVANAFAAQLPHARVHVLGARRDLTPAECDDLAPQVTHVLATSARARLDYLMRMPRPQVIIEAGNQKRMHKLRSFRDLYYFLTPGGYYAVEDLDSCGNPKYDDGAGQTVLDLVSEVTRVQAMPPPAAEKAPKAVRELAAASDGISFRGPRVSVRRAATDHHLKLRDWEADEVLRVHFGDGWGRTLSRRPGREFRSRAEVTSHGEGPIPSGVPTYEVPDLYFRKYADVVCTARQIVRYGGHILPDSWRHPHQPNLNNRQLVHSSPYFDRFLERTAPTSSRRAGGAFCYLDTELPGHFGHITTDVLSRVWSWEAAVRQDPSVRPLVSVSRPPQEIPGFQREIFAALGIPVDRALIIGPREEVEVETLYGGTPQLENPHYVDPDLTQVWRRLADGLPPGAPATADKIFVSRRPSPKRHCVQTADLEQFFADEGFRILFPEDHSYRDQKMIFARARVIAGFGGSGMFNIMFAPKATVVLISGHSYNAENERLIAAANGNELHYFWGRSELDLPPGGFSYEAFTSTWTFDLRRHERALRQVLRG